MSVSVKDVTVARGSRLIACPEISLQAGQTLALAAPSGAGKTSLLLAMAGILKSKTGQIEIDETRLWSLSENKRAVFRGRHIGYVFASFHLVDALNVMDNLQLARICADLPPDAPRAEALLSELGLQGLEQQRTDRLSQGQMQRVALARALMNRPKLLLCDEPTAALDEVSALRLIDLLKTSAARDGAALIVATHDRRVMDAMDSVVRLDDEVMA